MIIVQPNVQTDSRGLLVPFTVILGEAWDHPTSFFKSEAMRVSMGVTVCLLQAQTETTISPKWFETCLRNLPPDFDWEGVREKLAYLGCGNWEKKMIKSYL